MSRNPLIVAADLSDPGDAEFLAKRLAGLVAFVKVGLTLFVAAGPGWWSVCGGTPRSSWI